jgi:hypothetical protein
MTKETLVTCKNPIALLAMGHVVTITCLDTGSRILTAVLLSISPVASKKPATPQDKLPDPDDKQDAALHAPPIFESRQYLDNWQPWLHTLVWIQATSLDTNLSSDEQATFGACMHSVKRKCFLQTLATGFFPTMRARLVTFITNETIDVTLE